MEINPVNPVAETVVCFQLWQMAISQSCQFLYLLVSGQGAEGSAACLGPGGITSDGRL